MRTTPRASRPSTASPTDERERSTALPATPRVLPLRGVVLCGEGFTARSSPHTLQRADRDLTVRGNRRSRGRDARQRIRGAADTETEAVVEAIGRSRLFRGVAERGPRGHRPDAPTAPLSGRRDDLPRGRPGRRDARHRLGPGQDLDRIARGRRGDPGDPRSGRGLRRARAPRRRAAVGGRHRGRADRDLHPGARRTSAR